MLLSMTSSMLLVIDYDFAALYAMSFDMLVMLSLVMKLELYGYTLTMLLTPYLTMVLVLDCCIRVGKKQ